jgi:competence protein ComEA
MPTMESPHRDEPQAPTTSWWLRRADQCVIGAIVGAALVAMAGYWLARGGHRGELIEFDQASPLDAHFQVDLNAADWPEIAALPDIGEALARRIVAARANGGRFRTLDDLDRVPGIGPETIETIRPYLRPLE